ncbi:AAA-like domain-containing protein [Thermoleptolyngbya sp. C42_A2020_037]|uniref:AAA-like domain-containing protein n=1 Tax=Thermoleptolyngbya sp. C42_A2020_037 TaxID=2747799 RepID=UPI001A081671|nr:AAA-like domain-containing protein [Thermoleptolyngbya sp. C42_A2020_037]MBF2086865.1 AAA-like domain-containing protein [Thermoleptolyngbya sp. C42_A2020_037]
MRYQVGGSLRASDPTYVVRQADEHLYQALCRGEFCYVLNSRQMGKSSLLQRTSARLQKAGYLCIYLDITQLGSENLTPLQWYRGIITILHHGLGLDGQLSLKQWRDDHADLSPVQQLHQFVEDVLAARSGQQPIVVLIDEIDSLLSLPFGVSDFFAWIRHCYNQRSHNPLFQQLSFALFGVATPSDLIDDKRRTPFNIGTAIELFGFQPDEVDPLIEGLVGIVSQPSAVVRAILGWTNGQPFLTQKLCHLVVQTALEAPSGKLVLPPGTEALWIDQLVRSRILQHWESQDEPEHLKTIRDRLLINEHCASRLLGLYQQLLQQETADTTIPLLSPVAETPREPAIPQNPKPKIQTLPDSPEQTYLLLSGLVEKHNGILRVKNRIYRAVFDETWVNTQLDRLRPYAQSLNAWVESGFQDESRLLRGQALQAAVDWAQGKRLSDLDYQFLAASQGLDRRIMQQQLEAERLQEVEARLALERQSSRSQRQLLVGMSMALCAAVMSSLAALSAYQRSAVSEVRAIASASQGNYASHQRLDALLQAIQARHKFHSLLFLDPTLRQGLDEKTDKVLAQAVQGADETNRLVGHQGGVLAVDQSADGKWIASGGTDRTVKLWKPDGTLVHTLSTSATPHGVSISPNSQLVAAANVDGTVQLWTLDGSVGLTLKGHTAPVWNISFSPDSRLLVSASGDRTLKLWRVADGSLVRTLTGYDAATWQAVFSPDGQQIVSGSTDGKLTFWTVDGTLIRTIQVNDAPVWSVAYSPNGQVIATGSGDSQIRLWSRTGRLSKTLDGHEAEVLQVRFSADGRTLASASADRTVKLWRSNGTPLRTFQGHQAVVRSVAIAADNQTIASASEDGQVKLWKPSSLSIPLSGLPEVVSQVAYQPQAPGEPLLFATISGTQVRFWRSDGALVNQFRLPERLNAGAFAPDGKTLALGSADTNLYLLDLQSRTTTQLSGHTAAIMSVQYSPDGQFIASVGDDGTLRIWTRQTSGSFQSYQSILAHPASRIWSVAFSPDGQQVATAAIDRTVKVWGLEPDGQLTPEPQLTLEDHKGAVWGVAFSPDGNWLVSTGRDRKIRRWSRAGDLLETVEIDGLGLSRVAVSPDGQQVAVGNMDNTVILWNRATGRLLKLQGHNSGVRSIAFSPDGKTVTSGGEDRVAIIWKMDSLLDLDLMRYGCTWLRDYFRTYPNLEQGDRQLCRQFF